MLQGYAHMVDFFTSFDWWRTEPHDELVSGGNFCLAEAGQTYAVYLPKGGSTRLRLGEGRYRATWFQATTGEKIALGTVSGATWTSPNAPGDNDWALLLQREDGK